jgi:hypothetical protein
VNRGLKNEGTEMKLVACMLFNNSQHVVSKEQLGRSYLAHELVRHPDQHPSSVAVIRVTPTPAAVRHPHQHLGSKQVGSAHNILAAISTGVDTLRDTSAWCTLKSLQGSPGTTTHLVGIVDNVTRRLALQMDNEPHTTGVALGTRFVESQFLGW